MAKPTPYAKAKDIRDKMSDFMSDNTRTLLALDKAEVQKLLDSMKMVESERRNLRSEVRQMRAKIGYKTRLLD